MRRALAIGAGAAVGSGIAATALVLRRKRSSKLGGPNKEAAGVAGSSGLRHLAELIEHAERSGLTVRVYGEPGTLPDPVDAIAYRIVQEALTNVIRHAAQPTFVYVHFGQSGQRLRVVVRDDGREARQPKLGRGLRGLQTRTESIGGTFRAYAREGGGIEIHAELPIGPR